MFDRLTTLPHGLRIFVEALLYGLQHVLMLPARDAPLHAGAALLERTVATRICPAVIGHQLLELLAGVLAAAKRLDCFAKGHHCGIVDFHGPKYSSHIFDIGSACSLGAICLQDHYCNLIERFVLDE